MDARETNAMTDSLLGGTPGRGNIRGRRGVGEPELWFIDPQVPGTRDMMRAPHINRGGGENDWSLEFTKRKMQKA